jgi:hypothetical protein
MPKLAWGMSRRSQRGSTSATCDFAAKAVRVETTADSHSVNRLE